RRAPRAPAWLAAAAITLAAGPARGAAPPAAGPPVVLVETRPVESTLGNPALPSPVDVWLEMIADARTRLDFEEFYLSTWPGEPTERILAALGAAAARGVRVRLILDARMHRTYPRPADSLARMPGFEVRLVDFGRIAGGIQHAKFFVADAGTVFLGSQNLDWRALEHIHELGVRIRDPRVAAEYQRVFDMDWEAATPAGQAPDTTRAYRAAQVARPPGSIPYRIAQAPGDTLLLWPGFSPRRFIPDTTLWDRDLIVRLIDGARHEVVAQVLTYGIAERGRGPRDDAIDAALRRAAARGVAVRLIVSDWETGSPGLKDLQALARVPGIEIKLSTVPEWSGGYIPFARVEHLKYAVADTILAWVGTSNWEPGYFHGTRNVSATMRNRALAGEARAVFEASWRAPGAAALDPGATYPARPHGEEAPAGKKKYGG
ncbi:MAG TPA: phospholipase D-like domain-containing protein, partial [Candidatus Eisenbacteria bacterium]